MEISTVKYIAKWVANLNGDIWVAFDMIKEILIYKTWVLRGKIEEGEEDISSLEDFSIRMTDILTALANKYDSKTKEILRKIPSMTW